MKGQIVTKHQADWKTYPLIKLRFHSPIPLKVHFVNLPHKCVCAQSGGVKKRDKNSSCFVHKYSRLPSHQI